MLGLGYIHLYPPGYEDQNSAFQYTELSKAKWEGSGEFKGILGLYEDKEFSGEKNAYWFIGNIAHLTEDMTSAAHAYSFRHGSLLHPSHLFDNMELFGGIIVNNIPSLNMSLENVGSKENVWDYQESTRTAATDYCGGSGVNYWCGSRYTKATYDSFPHYPVANEPYEIIVDQLLSIGVEHTARMFMTASEKLPPVIQAISGDDLPCGSLFIAFWENRTQDVDYWLWVNGNEELSEVREELDDQSMIPNTLPWGKGIFIPYSEIGMAEKGSYLVTVKVRDLDGNSVQEDRTIFIRDCPAPSSSSGGSGCSSYTKNTSYTCNLKSGGFPYCEGNTSYSSSSSDCPNDPQPPDDNNIISNLILTDFPNYDPNSPVGLLASGLIGTAMRLTAHMKQPVRLVDPTVGGNMGLTPDLKVLIIPTDGLSNFVNSESFARQLEEFINNGGSVIAFSQSRGNLWQLLPGELDAYGYSQDVSCFRGGGRLKERHPVLSSEDQAYSGVHLDGFFVNYPPETEELLIRKSNGQPAMIVYPYGQGTVLASAMYPDYAYWTGQYDPDELKYLRDMITWALEPAARALPSFFA